MRIRLIAATLLPLLVAATPGRDLTPTQIDNRISRDGANAVVRAMSDQQFDRAMDHAASGDARWLRAVVRLYPGTDGARGEGVDKALSDALQTKPHEVLSLLQAHPNLPRPESLCEDRAIEPSTHDVTRFNERALRAVQAVNDPALQELRTACLASLRKHRGDGQASVPRMAVH